MPIIGGTPMRRKIVYAALFALLVLVGVTADVQADT